MKSIVNTGIIRGDTFWGQDILKVSENIEKIAFDIISGDSFTDIAKRYQLSTKTIYRLRQSEKFQAMLKEQKKKCFESALNQASYLSNVVINELKNIITDKNSNAQSKIQACKVVLELAKNNYEYENIEQRICELEKTVKV